MKTDPVRLATQRLMASAAEPDAALLGRIGSDEGAFAELVRRYGRLVWAACRHRLRDPADADDAFQATFLTLFRHAARLRRPEALSPWLYGVAARVCGRVKRAAGRRRGYEAKAGRSEAAGGGVADSAWDRTLGAVHEIVGELPESLRTPFVMCCLEGVEVGEAAARLGWKRGTVSARLSRAKDAVIARLAARGLSLGVIAALGLASPPSTCVARATTLATPGTPVPSRILHLTERLFPMPRIFGVVGVLAVTTAALLLAQTTPRPQPPSRPPPPPPTPPRPGRGRTRSRWSTAGRHTPSPGGAPLRSRRQHSSWSGPVVRKPHPSGRT
jgi:RNA polymerase sigma factor (sigma-70 family)